jgi:NAD(P)-dependent dehydrogenase (short-subunit alcohol dehydrogenase family)
MNAQRTVFIAAISSDIGRELALLHLQRGDHVIGTYRNADQVSALQGLEGLDLLPCDLSNPQSITNAVTSLKALDKPWDVFISAVGDLRPIGPFFESDVGPWAQSIDVNGSGQLRLLHAVYPHRRPRAVAKVAFLVGGGINGPFRNYSAYCLGKILLVKACELLHDEAADVHAVAIGTGWVDTKIHRQTLDAGKKAGANYRKTADFLASGQAGTTCSDILACMDWCFSQDRAVTGGRNISVVHDGWREGVGLAADLLADPDKYRLRRSGN